ncbi:MAG: 50S ribosomal protein L15 [Spirochaetales bacterium]|nr:50S ribosomal protein L15 [Spirochaetales bacterium]
MSEFSIRVPKGATKRKKRVGRGAASGTGCTAGRGNKGQNSRSGGGVRPGFEGGQMPLYRRIARRGFSNSIFKKQFVAVNIDDLAVFKDGSAITLESLAEKGLIKKSEKAVKILGRGECTKKYIVEIEKVSAQAKEKIEKAGGSVKVFESEEKPEKSPKKKESKGKKETVESAVSEESVKEKAVEVTAADETETSEESADTDK